MALASICFGSASDAGQLALGAGGGVEYASNVMHVPDHGPNDTIRSVFAGLVYRERTPELSARIDGISEYRDYRNDSYGDEFISNLDAYVSWGIVPQTFEWRFSDRFQQATIDPLAADTPTNRTDTNIFSTGPDFRARLGVRNSLLVGGRFSDVAVQESVGGTNLDNNRYGGHAGWRYDISQATNISLNYAALQVAYDDPVANEDFIRHDYFLRLYGRPGPTRYEVEWGTTRIYRESREPLSGRLVRLMLGRQISSNTNFLFRLASEFSDTGGELSPLVDPENWEGAISLLPAVLTTDVFYSQRADVTFTRTGQLGVNFNMAWRELDYETQPDDRAEYDALASLSYLLSRRVTTGLGLQYRYTKWFELDRTDERYYLWLRFSWHLNRNWTTNIWVNRDSQDSTDYPNNYSDNRVGLNLVYRTSPLFALR